MNQESEKALNTLLTEMDGLKPNEKRPVFVIAATNFPVESGSGAVTLDKALVRRFDRKIIVDLPNKAGRKKYLDRAFADRAGNETTEVMRENVANRSVGMSLANLEDVVNYALRVAQRDDGRITDGILDDVFETVTYGEEKKWDAECLERTAWHEAGHTFIEYLSGRTPEYVTIVARGNHAGYSMPSSDEDRPIWTAADYLAKIRALLAGRAAEIVKYGNEGGLSSGPHNDLSRATHLARSMICELGMDPEIGLMVIDEKTVIPGPLAEKIAFRIEEVLKTQMNVTIQSLTEHKEKMERLVSELYVRNSLYKKDIERLLKCE